MGLLSGGNSKAESSTNAATQGQELDDALGVNVSNIKTGKNSSVAITTNTTDLGAVSAAFEALDAERDDDLEAAGMAFQFASERGAAADRIASGSLLLNAAANEQALDFAGEAVEFIDAASDRVLQQSAEIAEFSALQAEKRAQAAERASAARVEAAERQARESMDFVRDVSFDALDEVGSFAAGAITLLDESFDDTTETIGQFSAAAIDRFVEASASDSEQTRNDFLKFATIGIIAMAGAFAVTAYARG